MVLPDWDAGSRRPPRIQVSHAAPPPGDPSRSSASAAPLARLGAVIVDVTLILTPTHVLLTAPLKRRMTAAMLAGTETSVAFYAGLTALAGVGLLVLYQSLCHHYFGRTPGKRAFGLRVRSVFGEPSTFGAQLCRAFAFVASALCLGLPFLSVLASARRRPLHDRVADTIVVRDEGPGAGPAGVTEAPGPALRKLVATIYASAALAFAITLTVGLREWSASGALAERLLAGAAAGEGRECEAISQAVDPEDADEHARVRQALTFYAAGLADRSCLETEIDREAAVRTEVAPVTYLAQAFVNADDADVSNAYLDRVCADAQASVECAMSRVVTAWSDSDWTAVGRALASVPAGSGYLDVWGVRHFARQADYPAALTALDALNGRPELSSFTLVQRVKAYYGDYRAAEAHAAFAQAVTTLDDDEARELGAWTCHHDLNAGCEALTSAACGRFAATNVGDADARAASNTERLVRTRVLECRAPANVDYGILANQFEVTDGAWRTLYDGANHARQNDRTAAARAFTEVLADESAPALLRSEATRRFAAIASPRQWRDLVATWEKVAARDAWVHAGNVIFAGLVERRDLELALSVADTLAADHALSPSGRVSLARLGGVVPTDEPVESNGPRVRAPASRDDE